MTNRITRALLRACLLLAATSVGLAAAESSGSLEVGLVDLHREASGADVASDVPVVARRYAPSRQVDVLHVQIDVTPDFDKRTIAARTTLRFAPVGTSLAQLRLDAVDLAVSEVTATVPIRGNQVTNEAIVVTFASPVPAGQEAIVTVTYTAEPRRGLYFRTPDMGYPANEAHLFSQGEPIEARHWFPGFDEPNEKFTSEVIVHVPAGMVALSNGHLVSRQAQPGTKRVTFRWLQDQPHVNYLVSLVVGPFESLRDDSGRVPLAMHFLPSQARYAAASFERTRDMMDFLERETGTPYPWVKYDQVFVADFIALGMENTSLSTLSDRLLFAPESEKLRSNDWVLAHELAHQWFGDLVTTKDWSHAWLNEGFATYFHHRYAGHREGADVFRYGLYRDLRRILEQGDATPLVKRDFNEPIDQFRYWRAYSKGAWTVHMLRSQLGDELFAKVLRTYLERHGFSNAVTEDLNRVLEEVSGRSFDRFFDQWVYHGGLPELQVQYAWDEHARLATLSLTQTQQLGPQVLTFAIPLRLRFVLADGQRIDRDVVLDSRTQDFAFSLPQAPRIVRVDPDFTVLAKVAFKAPPAMLAAQLDDARDMIGRLQAIEQLAQRQDRASIELLAKALRGDAFYGVRIAAAEGLRKIHTREALMALVESARQPDARVRSALVEALSGFYREEAFAALRELLSRERNPHIVADALEAIGAYSKQTVPDLLLSSLQARSFRNEVGQGAIAGMRAQDDPRYVGEIRRAVETHGERFTRSGLGQALDALAFLGRHQGDKKALRSFIAGFTRSSNVTVQRAALAALGTLEDPGALPILKPFADGPVDSPARSAAERALAALQNAREPSDELKDLREEVLDLHKQNDALRKDVEGLQRREEAMRKPTD